MKRLYGLWIFLGLLLIGYIFLGASLPSQYDGVVGGTAAGVNSVVASATTVVINSGGNNGGQSASCLFRNREAAGGVRLDLRFNGDATVFPVYPGEALNTDNFSRPFVISQFSHQGSADCTACLVWNCVVDN